jgi:hypothetical protein
LRRIGIRVNVWWGSLPGWFSCRYLRWRGILAWLSSYYLFLVIELGGARSFKNSWCRLGTWDTLPMTCWSCCALRLRLWRFEIVLGCDKFQRLLMWGDILRCVDTFSWYNCVVGGVSFVCHWRLRHYLCKICMIAARLVRRRGIWDMVLLLLIKLCNSKPCARGSASWKKLGLWGIGI